MQADVAHHQVLAGIDIHRQWLGKTDAVELAADLAAFLQPVDQRFAFEGDMNDFEIVQFQRLLEKQRQRLAFNSVRQFVMRLTAEHAAHARDFKRGFIAVLLLDLNTALDDSAQFSQHRLLAPGMAGHQGFQLLRHQIHAFDVMPQAIFQQDQVDRRDGVAAAKEGAGLQQTDGFFPAAIGNVRRIRQGI